MGIEWRESLSIGVAEIDNQHKELLGQFDKLLKACEAGKGMPELRSLFEFLDDYVVRHFNSEEGLQRLRSYPGYEAHKKEHDSFISRINKLKGEIKAEGVAIHHVMETNSLLLKWLINHISKFDLELGKFLRATNLS